MPFRQESRTPKIKVGDKVLRIYEKSRRNKKLTDREGTYAIVEF